MSVIARYSALALVLMLPHIAAAQVRISKSEPVNVLAFGAVADGVTDDAAAFEAAAIAADALGGGTVFVPAGTYAIDTDSVINLTSLSDITIRGEGLGTKIVAVVESTDGRSAAAYVWALSSCTNVVIRDLSIEGQHLDTSDAPPSNNVWMGGISLSGCTDCQVRNVRAKEFRRCFYTESSATGCVFVGCTAEDSYIGYTLYNGSNNQCIDCVAEDCRYDPETTSAGYASGYAFLMTGTETNSALRNCLSSRAGDGCYTLESTSSGCVATGIQSLSTKREGVRLAGGASSSCTVSDWDVVDCGDSSFWTGNTETFTVDTGTELLTTGGTHGLIEDDQVVVHNSSTYTQLPAGLNTQGGQIFYVIADGLTTTACKLSLTEGGGAVDITTTGSGGTHYIVKASEKFAPDLTANPRGLISTVGSHRIAGGHLRGSNAAPVNFIYVSGNVGTTLDGIRLEGFPSSAAMYINSGVREIANCTLVGDETEGNSNKVGLHMDSSCVGAVVTGCTLEGWYDGILVSGTDNTISSNFIQDSRRNAIRLVGADNNAILGNYLSNNAYNTTDRAIELLSTANNNYFDGNTIEDRQGAPTTDGVYEITSSDLNNRLGVTHNPSGLPFITGTGSFVDWEAMSSEFGDDLDAAITAAEAATNGGTVIVNSACTLAGDVAADADVVVKVVQGGQIIMASDYDLTINGGFECVDGGIDASGGTGAINLGPHQFSARWFGAVADGVTDDEDELEAAIASSATSGAPCYLPPGQYAIDAILDIVDNAIVVFDEDAELLWTGSDGADYMMLETDMDNVSFHNLTCNANELAECALYFYSGGSNLSFTGRTKLYNGRASGENNDFVMGLADCDGAYIEHLIIEDWEIPQVQLGLHISDVQASSNPTRNIRIGRFEAISTSHGLSINGGSDPVYNVNVGTLYGRAISDNLAYIQGNSRSIHIENVTGYDVAEGIVLANSSVNAGITIGSVNISHESNNEAPAITMRGGRKWTATFANATDLITATGHNFTDGEQVLFTTTGALPAEIAESRLYYVRDSATNEFKIEETIGGGALDFTDDGSATTTATVPGGGAHFGSIHLRNCQFGANTTAYSNVTVGALSTITGTGTARPVNVLDVANLTIGTLICTFSADALPTSDICVYFEGCDHLVIMGAVLVTHILDAELDDFIYVGGTMDATIGSVFSYDATIDLVETGGLTAGTVTGPYTHP